MLQARQLAMAALASDALKLPCIATHCCRTAPCCPMASASGPLAWGPHPLCSGAAGQTALLNTQALSSGCSLPSWLLSSAPAGSPDKQSCCLAGPLHPPLQPALCQDAPRPPGG